MEMTAEPFVTTERLAKELKAKYGDTMTAVQFAEYFNVGLDKAYDIMTTKKGKTATVNFPLQIPLTKRNTKWAYTGDVAYWMMNCRK